MFEIVLTMVQSFCSIVPICVALILVFNIVADLLWGGK